MELNLIIWATFSKFKYVFVNNDFVIHKEVMMTSTRRFSCYFVFDLFCYYVHALFRKESLRNQ